MVQLDRSPEDAEGLLVLHETALVFRDAGTEHTRTIGLTDIQRIKRVMGSPVLMVHSVEGGSKRVTAFYFTKPPALHPEQPTPEQPPPTLIGPFSRGKTPSRRKQRRKNASYLSVASGAVTEDLKTWVREIRSAVGRAQGEQVGS
jgi:hypothetical protein